MTNYSQAYQDKSIALIGYGVTGKACAEFLLEKGARITVFDKAFVSPQTLPQNNHCDLNIGQSLLSKSYAPNYAQLNDNTHLTDFDLVVVSPGVNLQQAFIQEFKSLHNQALNDKVPNDQVIPLVIGEIELFAQEFNYRNSLLPKHKSCPKLITVTGSNGKSTIVDMLTKALLDQNLKVGLGGNFGRSALTLLKDDLDIIILELSSFQLETTFSLKPFIACVNNISSDHLDRHGSLQSYTQAKQKIYCNATHKIANRDDLHTHPVDKNNTIYFGQQSSINRDDSGYYHNEKGIFWQLGAQDKGDSSQILFDLNTATVYQDFQLLNMQVVMACIRLVSADIALAAKSLAQYKGLAHRFEMVLDTPEILWINDSKATNPGASIAAIESLAKQVSAIVLIVGGDAKGADLSELTQVIRQHVKHLILIGKDASNFASMIDSYEYATSMLSAVKAANEAATQLQLSVVNKIANKPNKIGVLLAPACASIDMFANYQERGQHFVLAVHSIAGQPNDAKVIA